MQGPGHPLPCLCLTRGKEVVWHSCNGSQSPSEEDENSDIRQRSGDCNLERENWIDFLYYNTFFPDLLYYNSHTCLFLRGTAERRK